MPAVTFYNLPGFKDSLTLNMNEEGLKLLIGFYKEINRGSDTGYIWIEDQTTNKKYYIRASNLAACTMEISQ